MSIVTHTGLLEEATPSMPVDDLAVSDGLTHNEHSNDYSGADALTPTRANAHNGHARRQALLLPVERIEPNLWQPRTLASAMTEVCQLPQAHTAPSGAR